MNAAHRETRARPTAARLRGSLQIEIVRLRGIRNSQLSAILFASTTCKQSMPKMGGLSVQGGSPVFGAIINLHLDLRQR